MRLLDDLDEEYANRPGTPLPAQPARSRVPPVRGSRSHIPAAAPPSGKVLSKRPGRRIRDPYLIPDLTMEPINAEFKDEVGDFFEQPVVDKKCDPVGYHVGERAAKRLSHLADLAIDILSAPGMFIPCYLLHVTADTILRSNHHPPPLPVPPCRAIRLLGILHPQRLHVPQLAFFQFRCRSCTHR